LQPFICANRTNNVPRSVDEPMAAITTSPGGGQMLIEPFLLLKRQHDEVRSLDEPMPTITASGTNHFVVEPFLVESNHSGDRNAKSIDDPLPTITQRNGVGVVEPFIVPEQIGRNRSVEEPLPVITSTGRSAHVIEPFIVPQQSNAAPRSAEDPLPTVMANGRSAHVLEPFIIPQQGDRNARSVEDPLPTIVAQGRSTGIVEPVFVAQDGSKWKLVWLHRMLQPEELGIGQDFEGYEFVGTREQQTKQIGNAVPIKLARAMTAAAFHDLKPLVAESQDEAAA
jgi:DNA (cytosine-5)-methyltransferase 1